MKTNESSKVRLIGLAFLLLFLLTVVPAIGVFSASSLIVTLTGVVLPPEQPERTDAYTLHFRNHKWNFRVTDVHVTDTYPGGVSGRSILNDIGRERIRLMGNGDFIEPLNKAGSACGEVTIRGILYVSTGTLGFATVEQAPGNDSPEQCG